MKKLPAVLTVFAMLLFLLFGDTAADAVSDSLRLCVRSVIPPLFPYMVLSSLILSLDLFGPLYRRIPAKRLPGCTVPVIITGILCGFPVGAAGAAQLVRDGKISQDDAAKLCAVSSAASPAFVIGAVGQWWTREYGILLWLTQVITSLLLAAAFFRPSAQTAVPSCETRKSVPGTAESFCSAIASAAQSCLAVTAFITFFGTSASVLSTLIPPLEPLFSTLLEFSRGTSYGARTGGLWGIVLTGSAVGFSGISVLMQSASYLLPEKVPMKPVITAKLVTMASSAAVSAFYYLLRRPGVSGIPASGTVFPPAYAAALFLALGSLAVASKAVFSLLKRTEINPDL